MIPGMLAVMNAFFMRIHVPVRLFQQLLKAVFIRLFRKGIAHGNADIFSLRHQGESLDPAPDFFLRAIPEDNREFISADAVAVAFIRRLKAFADTCPRDTKQLVARDVAPGVIRALQIIHVEQQHPDCAPGLADLQQKLFQAVPVGQICQRIRLSGGAKNGFQLIVASQ